MVTKAGLDEALEPMAQNAWTLALFWGLKKARLNFFHGEMDRDKTLRTQGNSFEFAPGTTNKSHQTSSSLVGLLECFPCNKARTPLCTSDSMSYVSSW